MQNKIINICSRNFILFIGACAIMNYVIADAQENTPVKEHFPTVNYVVGQSHHQFPDIKSQAEKVEHLKQKLPKVLNQKIGYKKAEIVLKLTDGEVICGFGQRFDKWNLRGVIVECWAQDLWCNFQSSYFAVPFFISSEGYAVFINCTGKIIFDCGATKSDELRIAIPDSGINAFIFYGSPSEIIKKYTHCVGRPERTPSWVFQPWLSRNSYYSAYEIDRIIEKMKKYRLKAGAVVLECWAEGLQSFTFEEKRYPKPKEWIKRLHADGYHVVLWETPSIWTSASTYPIAKEKGYLVKNPDGTELIVNWLENGRKIDFRKDLAKKWWQNLHNPLVEMGVDGFKTDGGERMPDPFFHNLHPYYYQRSALDAFKKNNKSGITFARSANPLCSGNSTFWAGDQISEWKFLPAVLRAGLSAAMSGFPLWGHDIGGYDGIPDKALYIRWLQLGTFSPIMQFHGVTPREPWYYDDETIEIAKYYFNLRDKLQPYILATAEKSYISGTPILRPLAFEYPENKTAWAIDDQFMFGNDLLIAPVIRNINYAKIPDNLFCTSNNNIGLKAEYFSNINLRGKPITIRTDQNINFSWGNSAPCQKIQSDNYSVRWTGKIGPIEKTGEYILSTDTDDGIRFWINNNLIIDNWKSHIQTINSATIYLESEKSYPIKLEYFEQGGEAVCKLGWLPPDKEKTKKVWLPPGEWINVWNKKKYKGSTNIFCELSLSSIPVFAKLESFNKIGKLFHELPDHKTENIVIKLIGEKNKRGIVPNKRILRETKYEKVFLVICNNLSTDINCKIDLHLPKFFKLTDKNQNQVFINANSKKIVEFDIKISKQIPVDSYPISLSCIANGKKTTTPILTFVKLPEWHVLGLFDGGVGSNQKLDATVVNLNKTYAGKKGTVRWHAVGNDAIDNNGYIDLGKIVGTDGGATSYTYTTIKAEKPQKVKFLMGSGDALTVWLNGSQIFKKEFHRCAEPDEDSIREKLRKGKNSILVKVSRDLGPNGLYFRMIRE